MTRTFRMLARLVILLSAFAGAGCTCGNDEVVDPRDAVRSALTVPTIPDSPDVEAALADFADSDLARRWREGVAGLPTVPADDETCRAFCRDWCPAAAQCRIGPYAKVQRCKRLCLDPCMEGLWPSSFAQCVSTATDCAARRACAQSLLRIVFQESDDAPEGADPPAP